MKKGYDYVERRYGLFRTVMMTATAANQELIEGLDAVTQTPGHMEAEKEYLEATALEDYRRIGEARLGRARRKCLNATFV